jgi:hypothetical protein
MQKVWHSAVVKIPNRSDKIMGAFPYTRKHQEKPASDNQLASLAAVQK